MEKEADSASVESHPYVELMAPKISAAARNIDALARLRLLMGPVSANLKADVAAVAHVVSLIDAAVETMLVEGNLKSAKVQGQGTFTRVNTTSYGVDDFPNFVKWLESQREAHIAAHGAESISAVYAWLGTKISSPMAKEHLDLHRALPDGIVAKQTLSLRFTPAKTEA